MGEDHELEVLLNLDGLEFLFTEGYRVKIAAQVVETTSVRPHGIKLEKPNHRIVPRKCFEQLPTMDAVLHRLFGPLP